MSEFPYQFDTENLDIDLSVQSSSRLRVSASAEHSAGAGALSVDLDIDGKQHGHLSIPCPSEHSAFGHLRIPVCVLRNGKGPTVTLIAGIHGDEFEGPLALQRLSRELDANDICGCLILVPSVNLPAVSNGSRFSPLDGRDLDACFPGASHGTVTEQLAQAVFEHLIRPAELVLDIRSGGRSLQFAPSAVVRFSDDKDHQQTTENSMVAFGAPNSVRLPESNDPMSLQRCVAAAGIRYLQTELGGGGSSSAETLEIARTGCRNLLIQMGVLNAEIILRASRMLEVRGPKHYVYAETYGLLEPVIRLGNDIWHGNALAHIIDPSLTGAAPVVIPVPFNGVLYAIRHGGRVTAGDCIAIIADEVSK